MIAALFRSKIGVLILTVLVCGIFFTLSKLKRRHAQEEQSLSLSTQSSTAGRAGGAEQAALLKRSEESARGRAETARFERQSGAPRSSYDDEGDAYSRRVTPDPVQSIVRDFSGDRESRGEPTADAVVVPTLRIRGRKMEPDPLPVGTSNPLTHLVPSLPSIPPNFLGDKNAADKNAPAPASSSGGRVELQPKPQRFVPFGRLIKAELVITLESTEEEMPLVGLITEPVYNNGKLIIPAGTELHSMARADRIRDRIISTTTWRLIFPREGNRPNGRQLTFDGIALDREDGDGNGLTWGLTDGSYGLRGRVVRAGQTQEELMLFAAEAIRAAAGTGMDRQATLYGQQPQVTAKNAAIAGGQAVLERMAERISREIERNGVYVQVPAGKQFYVYPRQVIDPDRADIPDNLARVE